MDKNQIQEIQVTIEEAKKAIEDMELVIKLINSKPFKNIIGKQYFEEESVRLVGLLSEEGLDDKQMAGVHRQMFGISNLQRFLREKITLGRDMEQTMLEAQEELDRPEGD